MEKKDSVVIGGEGGDGKDVNNVYTRGIGSNSTVIASRRLLRGGHFRAQHSAEAVFTAIASLAFVRTAIAAIVNGDNVGGDAARGEGSGGNSGAHQRGRFPGPAKFSLKKGKIQVVSECPHSITPLK